jgi:DNA-binding SARP family transcriptional activator/class 3 adenylate cyclase
VAVGADLPDGTVTFLFTDIEGSTRLVRELRGGYAEVRGAHRRLLRAAFERFGGREVDTQGDSFFFAFERATDAVEAAARAQQAVANHDWPAGHEVRVRMGLHTGEPNADDEGYFGLGVHRAARICAAGHGGQVLLSGVTRDLVVDDLHDGLALTDLGAHTLKDLDRPERIYQLVYPGVPKALPPLKTGSAPEPAVAGAVMPTFGLLGPLQVLGRDGPLPLGGAKQRALLALLLLNANRVVSRERLIDELWGDDPPETAVTTIQVYVSRLRKVLPADTLETRPPGYLLAADPEAIDLQQFEKLVADARVAEPERAARQLRDALSLWRGPPLAEFDEPFARIEGGRLEDTRVAALELRIEADLRLGRHSDLVGELEAAIAEHPHRERLRGQLMRALYGSGRQAEALAAYRAARAVLDELGIEPSEELRELERAILTQDPSLALPAPLIAGAVELPGPLRAISPFPFVGRAKELETLRSALSRAEGGEGGQVALIGAEAGSGKTRLARELAHEAATRGTLVLYGSAHPDVNVPYQPFVEGLEFLVRVSDPTVLDGYVGEGREDLARLLPGLAPHARVVDDPQAARRRLHNAVADLFARISRERPLFVVVDDIHWLDAASAELLRHLARAAPEMRLCLLATYRERSEGIQPGLASALADLVQLEGVTSVHLDGLSSRDIGDFIARFRGAPATDDLTESIASLTDGTPFLLCELWRALEDANSIEVANGGVRMAHPLEELASPGSIRDVVHYRLSRLAPETSAMLEVAAVAGPEFQLSALGDGATIAGAAEEAVESGMIEAAAQSAVAYRFTHELVRRALYDRLSSVRRAELHVKVGEALESLHGANLAPVLADLAHHFTVGASLVGVERAVDYNVRAGEAAMASLAFAQAAGNLSIAIELGLDGRVCDVACDLATALMDDGDLGNADRLLSTGLDIARRNRDGPAEVRFAVVRGHVLVRTDFGNEREVESLAEHSREALERSGDERGLAQACRLLSLAHLVRCEWRSAEEMLWLALGHAKTAEDKLEESTIAGWLAAALYEGPTPTDVAIASCESLIDHLSDDPKAEARVGCHLAVLLAMRGALDEARLLARRSVVTLDRHASRGLAATARLVSSEVDMLAGDAGSAEQVLRRAYEVLEQAGERTVALNAAVEIARALCAQGRYSAAEQWMAPLRDSLGQADVMVQAVGFGIEAALAGNRGALATAEQLARRAVAAVASTDAVNRHAMTLVILSDVLEHAGRDADSRRARDEALVLFESKGNLVGADQCRAAAATS